MEKINKKVLFILILFITLFINPKEMYDRIRAEKDISPVAVPILEDLGYDASVPDIKYVGRNIYQLSTDKNQFFIKRTKQGSHYRYEVFVEQELSVRKFD